jgi:hypothetical protein
VKEDMKQMLSDKLIVLQRYSKAGEQSDELKAKKLRQNDPTWNRVEIVLKFAGKNSYHDTTHRPRAESQR